MKIKTVTMTGADDSVDPKDLIEISRQFPFVEWGILFSRKRYGTRRFPSKEWLLLFKEALVYRSDINVSCHLCGSFVREALLSGITPLVDDIGAFWSKVQRVQLNTHGQEHEYDKIALKDLAFFQNKEFIFQYDNVNAHILKMALQEGVNCSTLFDLSHGVGALPENWPFPVEGVKCGYAGGLSPDNVIDQIHRIDKVVPLNYELWIDMETHIRSNNDALFDLEKVVTVLEKVKAIGFSVGMMEHV